MLRTLLALVLLPLAACDMVVSSGSPPARIQTDAEAYVATITERSVTSTIPFSYTNRSGRAAYLHGCRTPDPPSIEKWVADEWIAVYSPVVLACLGPPTPVRAGKIYRDEVNVRAGLSGSNLHPMWEAAEVEGIYRLRWSVEEQGDERVVLSNEFTLIVQDAQRR